MWLPLSRLLLLFVIGAAAGCTLVRYLSGLSWRRPEGLGLGLALGMGLNAGLMFILGLLHVPLGYEVNLAALGGVGIVFAVLGKQRANGRLNRDGQGASWGLGGTSVRSRLGLTSLALVVGFLVLRLILQVLQAPYDTWDEFSMWGTAAKAIYVLHSIDLRGALMPGFLEYPLLLPTNAASIAYALGRFAENYTKLASATGIVPVLLLLFGTARRLKLTAIEGCLFALMLLTSGLMLTWLMTTLYADFPFAVMYTAAAVAYLLVPDSSRPRGTLVLAGLLFGAAAWTRADGPYLVAATLVAMAVLDGRSGRIRLASLWPIALSAFALPVAWRLFLELHPQPPQATGQVLAGSAVLAGLLERVRRVTPAMLWRISQPGAWSGIWYTTAIAAVAARIRFGTQRAAALLAAIIGVHVLFYWFAYLFVFEYADALAAPSFDRYMAHVAPIAVLLVMSAYARFRLAPEVLPHRTLGELPGRAIDVEDDALHQ